MLRLDLQDKTIVHLKDNLAIYLILVLGFMIRLYGVKFGLPGLYHADETIVVNHALAYGTGDLNPHFFRIPSIPLYIHTFIHPFIRRSIHTRIWIIIKK